MPTLQNMIFKLIILLGLTLCTKVSSAQHLSIHQVEHKLDSLSAHYQDSFMAIAIFAELYEGMVEQQMLWLHQGKIKEPELMERMVANFYLLFEEAIIDYHYKDSCTQAWNIAFRNNQLNPSIKSLFLAVNAHVFHDLSLALTESFHTEELKDFKEDFFEINKLFDKSYVNITRKLSAQCKLNAKDRLYFNLGRHYFITNFKKQRKRAYKMAMTVNLERKTWAGEYRKQDKRIQKNIKRIDRVFSWDMKLVNKLKSLDSLAKEELLQMLKP